MDLETLKNIVGSQRITKLVIKTGVFGYAWVKAFQYCWEYHPEYCHKYVWRHKSFYSKFFSDTLLKYHLFPRVEIDSKGVDLSVQYGEHHFQNPLGNASGIDHSGWLVEGISNLGFGFVEAGEVTPDVDVWKSKPEYAKQYFINVLPNTILWTNPYKGKNMALLISNLCRNQDNILNKKYKSYQNVQLGINISPSRTTVESVPYLIKLDYENCMNNIAEFSDYIVINITEKDKSRRQPLINLREKEELTKLVTKVRSRLAMQFGKIAALEHSQFDEVQAAEGVVDIHKIIQGTVFRNSLCSKNSVPLLLLKIDSYYSEEEYKTICEVMEEQKVDGAIVGSTIPVNIGIKDKSQRRYTTTPWLAGAGGEVTKEHALRSLQLMYRYTQGRKLLISSGGIFTGKDLYERMAFGASLGQIFTALIVGGPYVPQNILEEFAGLLKENNETAQSIIGKHYR